MINLWILAVRPRRIRAVSDSAHVSRGGPDPWSESLELLSCSRRVAWAVASTSGTTAWAPERTENPRHRRGPYFLESEAIDFVVRRLREIVAARARRRSMEGVVAREETLMRDQSRQAFVMVVSGPFGFPPVYVKWTIEGKGPGLRMVVFHSFHASREHPRE